MKPFFYYIVLSVMLVIIECQLSKGVISQPLLLSTLQTNKQDNSYKLINDYFVKENHLYYNSYNITKLKKKARLEEGTQVDVSYAVVKKGKNLVAKVDGLYSGLGNETNFALFPLLGGKRKQLIIAQIIPRSSRYWIASLTPKLQIIFDSNNYKVGEEDLQVIDIDKDGVYEISLPLVEPFWGFNKISMSENPRPEIIFKYNKKTKKYFPANVLFQKYLLQGIETEINKLASNNESYYFSSRLSILLRYIYAGKEKEGWAFFNKSYNYPDRKNVILKIKSTLKREAIYKFIYRKRAT